MRWNQITLKESLTKYRPMFTGIYPDGKVPRNVEMDIQKIERVMQNREDRVIWALRWYRAGLVMEMTGNAIDATPEQRKMIDKAKRDLTEKGVSLSDSDVINGSDMVINGLDDFEHFWSLPIDAIKRIVFAKQSPKEIFNELHNLEGEWQDQLNDTALETGVDDGEENIIDFGNGWAWWHLDRPYCREEGKAMGHCGNSASYDSGDTILSLRQKIHGDHWEPHLTFILDDDHYLGEMKGKANEKPVERYHKMIVALLENDIVFGLKGGGYAPENNFSLSDLSREEQARLKAEKPGFRTLDEIADAGDKAALEKVVAARMQSRGWTYRSVDMAAKELVLNNYPSVESFANNSVDNYNNAFNEVRDELLRNHPDDGEYVYEQFYNEYYLEIIKDHIYDFNRYKADIGFDWPTSAGGPVTMTISFYALESALDGDEDMGSQINYDIDEVEDYHSWSDSDPSYMDDIDEEMCLFIAGQSKRSSGIVDLADSIYGTYSDGAAGGKYSNGTPTQNHPDQYNFKF